MNPHPDPGLRVYAARAITQRVAALAAEMGGVRAAEDIEYVHRMRVASRRLRAALPLFESTLPARRFSVWAKEIRAVTRALGAARDADVQVEAVERFLAQPNDPRLAPGLRRLALRLRQQRVRLQPAVIAALDHLERSRVLPEMSGRLSLRSRPAAGEVVSQALVHHAAQAISARLDELLGYAQYVRRPECIEELHAMRIAAKRLRYTLEIFASVYPGELKEPIQAVRKVQDLLGAIHDADVWEIALEEFIQAEQARCEEFYGRRQPFQRLLPGLRAFQEDRRRVRQEQYQAFVACWEDLSAQAVWDRLAALLEAPPQAPGQPPAAVEARA